MIVSVALLLVAANPGVTLERLDDELYAETYSWMADLDDGTYVLAQMMVSNLGPGDANAACRVIVVSPKGVAKSDGKTYDDDEWKLTKGVLEIGPCRFERRAGAKMHVVTDLITVDFETDTPLASRWPRDGRAKAGDGGYKVELLAAHHDVRVKIAGRKIDGRGFVNHSHSNALPADVARRWVRFRAVRDDPMIIHTRLPPSGGPATGFVLVNEREHRVRSAKIARRGKGEQLAFRALVDTAMGKVQITTKKNALFRDAPLEKYGWLGTILGTLLGNPVTYTFRARLERKGAKPIDGIAEFALID